MALVLTSSTYCSPFSKVLLGWKVVRLWQHELEEDFDLSVDRIVCRPEPGEDDTMIKVSVLPRHIGATLNTVGLSRRVTSYRTRQGVSLELRQFASPNERCSVESAPDQI